MLRQLVVPAAAAALVCLITAIPGHADGITVIERPTSGYISSTTRIDISGLADGTGYPSISGGGLTVAFFKDFAAAMPVNMVRLTVPKSWGTWNCPPATEVSCTKPKPPTNLPVLYSNGLADIFMTLSSPESVFGFEAQPDLSDVESMTATFFNGATDLGSITLMVSGNAGALLFAASSKTKFNEVELKDNAGAGFDFAIANVRFSPTPFVPTPEPASLFLLGTGAAGLGFWKLRRMIA